MYAAIRFRRLYKKHSSTGYADSSLEALNAKETFHAHHVRTRTLCISSKGIASKIHSRSAKPSCAELCEYQGRTITIEITFLADEKSSTSWPGIATTRSIHR